MKHLTALLFCTIVVALEWARARHAARLRQLSGGTPAPKLAEGPTVCTTPRPFLCATARGRAQGARAQSDAWRSLEGSGVTAMARCSVALMLSDGPRTARPAP